MQFLKYSPRKRCSFLLPLFRITLSITASHQLWRGSHVGSEAPGLRSWGQDCCSVPVVGRGGDWPSRPRSVTRPWLKLTNKTRNNCKIGTHSDLNRRRTLVIGWGRDSLQPIGRGSHFFSRRAAGPRVLHILAVPRRAWVHYYLQHCTRNTVHEVFLRMLKQLQVSIASSQHEYC